MANRRTLWLLLPRWMRRFPGDLAAAAGLVGATTLALVLPGTPGAVLQVVFGIPFVLLAPGYVVVAALFPERSERPADDELDRGIFDRIRTGISASERALLSVWLSIAIVPLLGLVVNFLPVDIRPATVLSAVGVFVLAGTAVAAVRRWERPPDERFEVRYARPNVEIDLAPSRTDLVLNLLLVGAVVLAVASVSYAVVVPDQQQSFTEFYLLSENETGELLANEYPEEFQRGQGKPMTVGINNHEGEAMNYTVIAVLERVTVENDTARVVETRRLAQFQAYVEANGTLNRRHMVTPEMTGERLRLQYLLFRGEPPAEPTAANAYRSVHVWINVTEQ